MRVQNPDFALGRRPEPWKPLFFAVRTRFVSKKIIVVRTGPRMPWEAIQKHEVSLLKIHDLRNENEENQQTYRIRVLKENNFSGAVFT